MSVSNLLDGMPDSMKFWAIICGLLSLGFTVGKASADFTQNTSLLEEVRAMRKIEQQTLCIEVANLRRVDWTSCLLNEKNGAN